MVKGWNSTRKECIFSLLEWIQEQNKQTNKKQNKTKQKQKKKNWGKFDILPGKKTFFSPVELSLVWAVKSRQIVSTTPWTSLIRTVVCPIARSGVHLAEPLSSITGNWASSMQYLHCLNNNYNLVRNCWDTLY